MKIPKPKPQAPNKSQTSNTKTGAVPLVDVWHDVSTSSSTEPWVLQSESPASPLAKLTERPPFALEKRKTIFTGLTHQTGGHLATRCQFATVQGHEPFGRQEKFTRSLAFGLSSLCKPAARDNELRPSPSTAQGFWGSLDSEKNCEEKLLHRLGQSGSTGVVKISSKNMKAAECNHHFAAPIFLPVRDIFPSPLQSLPGERRAPALIAADSHCALYREATELIKIFAAMHRK